MVVYWQAQIKTIEHVNDLNSLLSQRTDLDHLKTILAILWKQDNFQTPINYYPFVVMANEIGECLQLTLSYAGEYLLESQAERLMIQR